MNKTINKSLPVNQDNGNKPKCFVGIGASAGGLEAIQSLLQGLPNNSGATFIIVQHLSPDFKSMMLELLAKHTKMPIYNVTEGVIMQANSIYLIPPKKNMMVAEGRLLLSDKVPDSGLNLPIDIFFKSLAEDQQQNVIAIILSGTGSDGSRGISAMKDVGALVMVQEPDTAKFDGMPNSAIATGFVDLIVAPGVMGEKIETYLANQMNAEDSHALLLENPDTEVIMQEIFTAMRVKTKIDFSKYKASTVSRRIERRMNIKQINTLQGYLSLILAEPLELQTLNKELLIGVTNFFRDTKAFDHLRNKVIPELIEQSRPDAAIRIWVAACSTGEEAYSIAMLFNHELMKRKTNRFVKIFATDVNNDSINDASNGIYSGDIENDIDTEFLERYFNKNTEGNYQIRKSIRQMVVFATHNMIIDPPFSNIDLVSCRNALIYFQHSVQKRVLTSFHFSLRKNGILFLGSSENIGDLAPHFEVLSERQRLYRKKNSIRIPLGSTSAVTSQHHPIPPVNELLRNYKGGHSANKGIMAANEQLINLYAPPCILLNDELTALHVYGDVTHFIRRLPPGRISNSVNDIINEDISVALSSALSRAKESNREVKYTDLATETVDGKVVHLDLRVSYIKENQHDASPGYYWVVFESRAVESTAKTIDVISYDANVQSKQRIEDLEAELKKSKESLVVTVEELEATNEELQSANEELMSANEELQSTNEELQSVNEELYTVNSEYQEKIAEISQANGDLDEVLGLSKIGIVFLDENMLVRRYTKAATDYVNLLYSDIGRPLYHISVNIQYPDLLKNVSEVYTSGKSIEKEIVLSDKRVLRIALIPYQNDELESDKGVALTFSDVSKIKYTEMGMEVAYNQLRKSVNNALEALDNTELTEKLNVLLVDDNDIELQLMTERLQGIDDLKLAIHVTHNSDEALEVLEQTSIDLCISDYYLEKETALDLVDKLKASNNIFPTLVVTGSDVKDLAPMLISHGILDIIQKSDLSSILLSKSIRYAVRRKQIDRQIQGLLPPQSQ